MYICNTCQHLNSCWSTLVVYLLHWSQPRGYPYSVCVPLCRQCSSITHHSEWTYWCLTNSVLTVCQFEFKKPAVCQKVCTKTYDTNIQADKAKLDFLKKGMSLNYQHHWYVRSTDIMTWRRMHKLSSQHISEMGLNILKQERNMWYRTKKFCSYLENSTNNDSSSSNCLFALPSVLL